MKNRERTVKRRFPWLGLLDALLVGLSLLMALHVYYDMHPPEAHLLHVWRATPLLIVSTVAALWGLGAYRSLLQFASIDTLVQLAIGTLIGTGSTYLVSLALYSLIHTQNLLLMPRPIYLIQWLLLFLLMGGSRLSLRLIRQAGHSGLVIAKKHERRIMVVGAGWEGAQAIREIQSGRAGDCVAVLAVDDDPSKGYARIGRVPVLPDTKRIPDYVRQYAITEILVAIATPQGDMGELMKLCLQTGCKVRVFATMRDVSGRSLPGTMRDVNIADLLGRAENHLDMAETEAFFTGKRVLITGGGGSIGSELCRQIMGFVPAKLILYDISENYLYDLFFELQERYGAIVKNTVVLRIGSIRDEGTLNRVFEEFKPEIVLHAAAHKHVPLMEDSPEQAIINNVFGTLHVAEASVRYGVERFVMISTDKAVNPTNIMGASKRFAEIMIEAMQKKTGGSTQFTAVRFGNVLGSNGSVVPLFRCQIQAGGPVTLTHPDIIRYFMTIPEAASLVLQAASIAKGGDLFVLDMGQPVKIRELAERMIQLYADPAGPKVEIVYTGLRPGEKLFEELLRDEENATATSKEKIFIAKPEQVEWSEAEAILKELQACLDAHGDIRACMHKLLPSFHEPKEVNGARGELPNQ